MIQPFYSQFGEGEGSFDVVSSTTKRGATMPQKGVGDSYFLLVFQSKIKIKSSEILLGRKWECQQKFRVRRECRWR